LRRGCNAAVAGETRAACTCNCRDNAGDGIYTTDDIIAGVGDVDIASAVCSDAPRLIQVRCGRGSAIAIQCCNSRSGERVDRVRELQRVALRQSGQRSKENKNCSSEDVAQLRLQHRTDPLHGLEAITAIGS
jgi:hypothetical protein